MPSSSQATRLFELLAAAVAEEWVGHDPHAADLRRALAGTVHATLARINSLMRGGCTQALSRLLNHYLQQAPSELDSAGKEAWATRQVALVFLGFLPSEFRSLQSMLDELLRDAPVAAAEAESEFGSDEDMLPKEFADLLIDSTKLAAVWPGPDKLSKHLSEYLKKLFKAKCAGVVPDLLKWQAQVPIQAGLGFAIADALQKAFLAANIVGISKSNLDLGKQVHTRITGMAARSLAAKVDCYLVADDDVYLSGGRRRRLYPYAIETASIHKEFSLRILQQSRGSKLPAMIRGRKRTTSREDLIVFTNRLPGLTSTFIVSGPPEVYEIKSIGDLTNGVAQVTAYSWNYLIASIFMRCARLPGIPLARVDNPLMLPASPELHAIPVPSITVTNIAAISASGATNPANAAAVIAELLATMRAQAVSVPPYVAIPFMVTGLYGLIPYAVIEMDKLKKALQEVLDAILKALMAALAAYLAAKKLLEETGKQLEPVLARALEFWIALQLAMLVAALLVIAVLSIPEIALGAAVAGMLILIFAPSKKDAGTAQGENMPITINVGAMSVHGVTPRQFAEVLRQVRNATLGFFNEELQLPPDPNGRV